MYVKRQILEGFHTHFKTIQKILLVRLNVSCFVWVLHHLVEQSALNRNMASSLNCHCSGVTSLILTRKYKRIIASMRG